MAIVGEFSSGKSTLINAILADDLLKSSAIQGTTSVATYIQSGKNLTIEVKTDVDKFEEFKIESNINADVKQLIHFLTTDENFASNIRSLVIKHPANFLKEGITIIDTPGTNALKVEHGQITQNIIENEADSFIIIIPATTPLSQTLSDFLQVSLSPFLHRSIFVVTKMDQIRKREQESLIHNLSFRLKEMLGLSNPLILPAAPQVILDEVIDQEEISSRLSIWKDKFSELKTIVIKKLKKERMLILSENLLRLLTDLFAELEANLHQECQIYEQRQILLKNETIQDLESFSFKEKRKCCQKIEQKLEDTINQVRYKIYNYQESNKKKIHSAIMSVQNWEQLDFFVETGIEALLKVVQTNLENELKPYLININTAAQNAQADFDREFTRAYQKLQALGRRFNIPNINYQSVSVDLKQVFTDIQQLQTQQNEAATNRVISGAVIGVIGAILLPGVGAILGGLMGASLSRLFGPSLEERKQELWNQLEPNLNNYFQQITVSIQDNTRAYGKSLINDLELHVNSYMTQYKDTVDLMLHEQQLELNRLNDLSQLTQGYLKEISNRKNRIKQKQEMLAKVGVE